MSLSDYVAKFKNSDADYIGGGGTQILVKDVTAGMACHNATFIWLYRAKHGGDFPAIDDLLGGAPQTCIDNLIRFGHPKRVTSRSGPLAGDVLIFADPSAPTVGRHSCVVIGGGTKIAGYNQVGWFGGGLSHDYSEHNVSDIDWVARCCGFTPRRADAAGKERYIWAVREGTALSQTP